MIMSLSLSLRTCVVVGRRAVTSPYFALRGRSPCHVTQLQPQQRLISCSSCTSIFRLQALSQITVHNWPVFWVMSRLQSQAHSPANGHTPLYIVCLCINVAISQLTRSWINYHSDEDSDEPNVDRYGAKVIHFVGTFRIYHTLYLCSVLDLMNGWINQLLWRVSTTYLAFFGNRGSRSSSISSRVKSSPKSRGTRGVVGCWCVGLM